MPHINQTETEAGWNLTKLNRLFGNYAQVTREVEMQISDDDYKKSGEVMFIKNH